MIYRILAPSQVVGLGISEPSTVFSYLKKKDSPFPAHATKLERFQGCTCRKCLVAGFRKSPGEAFSDKNSKPGSSKRSKKKTCFLVERYIDHGYLNPKIR